MSWEDIVYAAYINDPGNDEYKQEEIDDMMDAYINTDYPIEQFYPKIGDKWFLKKDPFGHFWIIKDGVKDKSCYVARNNSLIYKEVRVSSGCGFRVHKVPFSLNQIIKIEGRNFDSFEIKTNEQIDFVNKLEIIEKLEITSLPTLEWANMF